MVLRYRGGAIPAVGHDPKLVAEFAPLAADVAGLLDRAEATQALELIWQRVRRLNRYVEETAPWQLAKDPADAGRLDRVLASLIEGIRALSVLLHPYIPVSSMRLLDALGRTEIEYGGASFAAQGDPGRVRALEPLFPKRS
jgi:methionyl-tRNA synthetase